MKLPLWGKWDSHMEIEKRSILSKGISQDKDAEAERAPVLEEFMWLVQS